MEEEKLSLRKNDSSIKNNRVSVNVMNDARWELWIAVVVMPVPGVFGEPRFTMSAYFVNPGKTAVWRSLSRRPSWRP